jgi:hypothetical protein
MGFRVPSAVVLGVGTLFFLLYLLPWQHLPSVPFPSPSTTYSQRTNRSSSSSMMSGGGSSSSSSSSYFASLQAIEESPPVFVLPPSPDPPGLVTYKAIREAGGGGSFNASGSDVLVILHIQKTGGTSFEKHIVQDLVMDKPCVCWKRRKRCKCPRPLKSTFILFDL